MDKKKKILIICGAILAILILLIILFTHKNIGGKPNETIPQAKSYNYLTKISSYNTQNLHYYSKINSIYFLGIDDYIPFKLQENKSVVPIGGDDLENIFSVYWSPTAPRAIARGYTKDQSQDYLIQENSSQSLPYNPRNVAWSSDGKKIAYITSENKGEETNSSIYITDNPLAKGDLVYTNTSDVLNLMWSPDGNSLLYSLAPEPDTQTTYVLDLTNKESREIIPNSNSSRLQFTPDNKKISYLLDNKIILQSFNNPKEQKTLVSGSDDSPIYNYTWVNQEKLLYISEGQAMIFNLNGQTQKIALKGLALGDNTELLLGKSNQIIFNTLGETLQERGIWSLELDKVGTN